MTERTRIPLGSVERRADRDAPSAPLLAKEKGARRRTPSLSAVAISLQSSCRKLVGMAGFEPTPP